MSNQPIESDSDRHLAEQLLAHMNSTSDQAPAAQAPATASKSNEFSLDNTEIAGPSNDYVLDLFPELANDGFFNQPIAMADEPSSGQPPAAAPQAAEFSFGQPTDMAANLSFGQPIDMAANISFGQSTDMAVELSSGQPTAMAAQTANFAEPATPAGYFRVGGYPNQQPEQPPSHPQPAASNSPPLVSAVPALTTEPNSSKGNVSEPASRQLSSSTNNAVDVAPGPPQTAEERKRTIMKERNRQSQAKSRARKAEAAKEKDEEILRLKREVNYVKDAMAIVAEKVPYSPDTRGLLHDAIALCVQKYSLPEDKNGTS